MKKFSNYGFKKMIRKHYRLPHATCECRFEGEAISCSIFSIL